MPIETSYRIAFLKKIHLFHGLDDAEFEAVANELNEFTIAKGAVVFEQDSKADGFYLIYRGSVRIVRKYERKEIQLALLGQNDYFGEMALVANRRRSATVTALEVSTLLVLSRANFEKLFKRTRHLLLNLEIAVRSRILARHLTFEWLQEGEVVYFIARKDNSWIIQSLTVPIGLALVCIPLIVWSVSTQSWFVVIFGAIPPFTMILWGIWKMVDWMNSYYIVTDKSIMSVKKILGVYVSRQEVLLNAILSIDVDRTATGKILDYGNIIVRTYVSKIEFTHVANLTPTEKLIKEYWDRSKQNNKKETTTTFQHEPYGDRMDSFEIIAGLKQQLSELPYQDTAKLDALRRRTEMIIRNLFGQTSKYLDDLKHISFHPMIIPSSETADMRSWKSGREEMENLFSTMEEELTLFQHPIIQDNVSNPKQVDNRIFIVHGHDEEMKQYVARIITRLGLDPIVLHEKPNQGRTIIEKFTDYSEVSFAVVLLSPDDIARRRNDAPDVVKSRARQNVVLELGYFLGKLGRNRVVVLYREESNFEMPSDYSGVLFVPFDSAGRWQFDLVKELKASGFNVDANKLV